MSQGVCGGALLGCSFGIAPAPLQVLPQNRVLSGQALANIMDNKPLVNIMSFGICSCPANPTVAAATAAAQGVLTPMPCVPVIPAPWAPGSPTVQVGRMPALTSVSKAFCMWGGVISVQFPGQFTVQLP